jgi:hypothetical protein
MTELVVSERGQEEAVAREPRELDGGDGAAAARLLPRLEGVHDLAGLWQSLDARELDPLDVPDDGDAHRGEFTAARRTGVRLRLDSQRPSISG